MEDPVAVVGAAGGLLLVTVLGGIATWRVLAPKQPMQEQPRTNPEYDLEYLKLADRATAAQERATDELAEMRTRLERLEQENARRGGELSGPS